MLKLSDKVISRLTLYHYILEDYQKRGIQYISSPQIAGLLRIDDTQVRKDLALLKNEGKCRVGYNIAELKFSIETTLGFETPKDAFIIGAGNLGFALAKYDDFSNYGLNILALFDNDPLKVDMIINKKEVFHISRLTGLTRRLSVDIAILTVPAAVAQETAELLVEAGIKYIWNFTPTVLAVPDDVQVWNENLIGNFLKFTYNK